MIKNDITYEYRVFTNRLIDVEPMEVGRCTSKSIKELKAKDKVDGRFFHTSDSDAVKDSSIAKSKLDTALTNEINGKQEALTLTVKDNGNIVLANIQGQSKEFMPATPSGDPMHYAYVAAGAEYNDTGEDMDCTKIMMRY